MADCGNKGLEFVLKNILDRTKTIRAAQKKQALRNKLVRWSRGTISGQRTPTSSYLFASLISSACHDGFRCAGITFLEALSRGGRFSSYLSCRRDCFPIIAGGASQHFSSKTKYGKPETISSIINNESLGLPNTDLI